MLAMSQPTPALANECWGGAGRGLRTCRFAHSIDELQQRGRHAQIIAKQVKTVYAAEMWVLKADGRPQLAGQYFVGGGGRCGGRG